MSEVPSALPFSAAVRRRLDVRSWHAGWSAGVAALAGLALLFATAPPAPPLLLALALLAAPGALALLPQGFGGGAAVAAWTALTAAALTVGGGVAGPLGPAAAAPALAGLALRRPAAGVAGACVAAAVASVLQVLGAAGPSPPPTDAAPLAAGLVALSALAVWGALRLAEPAEAVPDPRLEEAMDARVRAEREARARARALAEMSHELRTPLNAIVGFSDIMRQNLFGPLPGRYGEYAVLIHESGEHLAALINDVLDISKIDAERYELRRERTDPREPVASALKTVRGAADGKGVALHASLPALPLLADVDPRALKQIALNLLSNAVKFTGEGGEVTLSLAAASDTVLELTVADTGVGVGAEELARLGEPFVQGEAGRGAQGTGLGLSLVKALAGLHGGALLMESRLGEGTAATVRLPVLLPVTAAVGT